MSINPFYQKPIKTNGPDYKDSYELIDLNKPSTPFETIKYSQDEIIKRLHPGDIILSYCPKISNLKDLAILTGQKIKVETPNNRYCHIAIYLGEGKLAEAIDGSFLDGIDIKINTTTSKRFIENHDEYRIFRPKNFVNEPNNKLIHLAKNIARETIEENSLKKGGSYNYKTAILSSIKNHKDISNETIKNFFKGAYFAKTGEIPLENEKPQNFHCSYLVAWLLQAAESEKIIDLINEDLSLEEKITFPDFTSLNEKIKDKAIEKWALDMTKKHQLAVFDHLETLIDPSATTAADFFEYLSSHPDTYEYFLRILPQKNSLES